MDEYQSLSHTKWDCKYHVIFIPKYRRRVLYGQLRRHLGEVFRKLAEQKESRIEEGHLMPDHVHMMIAIPPKYAVSQVVVAGGGIYQGQERDTFGAKLRRAQPQLRGAALLGPGILRLNGWERRGTHPRVHPAPRGRGQTLGSDAALAIGQPPLGGSRQAGRVSGPRQAALSGSP